MVYNKSKGGALAHCRSGALQSMAGRTHASDIGSKCTNEGTRGGLGRELRPNAGRMLAREMGELRHASPSPMSMYVRSERQGRSCHGGSSTQKPEAALRGFAGVKPATPLDRGGTALAMQLALDLAAYRLGAVPRAPCAIKSLSKLQVSCTYCVTEK